MKRKYLFILLITVILITAVFMASCSVGSDYKNASKESSAPGEASDGAGTPSLTPPSDRKVVYTVRASLYTNNMKTTIDEVKKMLKEGEWIDKEEIGDSYGQLTLRIASTRLDAFINELSKKGDVKNYSKEASDVTEAYLDVESQIEILNKKKDSLAALYASTTELKDIMAIDSEIIEVEGEILKLQKQKNSLDSRIEYSYVYLYVNQNYIEVDPTFKEETTNDLKNSWLALGSFFKFLFKAIIYIFPFALVGGGIAAAIIIPIKINKKKKLNLNQDKTEDKDKQ